MGLQYIFEKTDEAIIRLEMLVKKVNLPSSLVETFKNKQSPMIDPMKITEINPKIAEKFTQCYLRLVEEQSVLPYLGFILDEDTIIYLFVSNNKDNWENERIKEDNYQYIYVCHLKTNDYFLNKIDITEVFDCLTLNEQ